MNGTLLIKCYKYTSYGEICTKVKYKMSSSKLPLVMTRLSSMLKCQFAELNLYFESLSTNQFKTFAMEV